jgi:hypothetical protein
MSAWSSEWREDVGGRIPGLPPRGRLAEHDHVSFDSCIGFTCIFSSFVSDMH